VSRAVVVGAGVGGLTTAALLARAGLDVTVLESHIYPGGCAGTFFNRGYRFDAGATLAGGFAPGGPMQRLAARLDLAWPAHPADPAMVAHLPGGERVTGWASPDRWHAERLAHFGAAGEPFWRWQERTADALWRLAGELPPWPPRSARDVAGLVGAAGRARPGLSALPTLVPMLALDAFRPVAAHLRDAPANMRQFVDGQLLIAAQATGRRATALYGAAALDLPRRGVVHLDGGIGAIAETLARSVQEHGGRVQYRQHATRVVCEGGRPVAVETASGGAFPADVVVLNLPDRGAATLLGEAAPSRLRHAPAYPHDGWSAFILHVGLDGSIVPPDLPLHHQVLVREPLGEGNSVFLSVSPPGDSTGHARRAPPGHRAVTISTHTRPGRWWQRFQRDRPAYEALKAEYTERLLAAAEIALPGLRRAADLVLPGTPLTFERYTGRDGGWVGGFPQTSLFRARPPGLGLGLWQVGDSIFPGQSTAAVALGGMRVARAIQSELGGSARHR
jgi:C-3',4' desaturase CrtD